ncbi:hypothetical protein HF086_014378 [Spodoptera exigua]|uniref:Uncharacterized protein n=1 Tax=Spodoptera exigua TaxID=7107 RepID=A0A922SBE7_SPOEX|nr:hypothetical protein HF086_014378 [Spodoptera exigua]
MIFGAFDSNKIHPHRREENKGTYVGYIVHNEQIGKQTDGSSDGRHHQRSYKCGYEVGNTKEFVILTAFVAVCGAAKLDANHLSPISAKFSASSSGSLQASLDGSVQGAAGLSTGSFKNDAQGVVVDAANPGTRTSGAEPTGLGGPRTSYGSLNSKVGEAAFTGSVTGPLTRIAPGFGSIVGLDDSEKVSGNTLKIASNVALDNDNFGFESDNGISVGENAVAKDGVKAEAGSSYKGDVAKTYSVSYTAGKGGYKATGPATSGGTLISLEKNAKEGAAGHIQDGSYDAKTHETGVSSGGATNDNLKQNGVATSSGIFASQGNQAQRPTSGILVGTYNAASDAGHSSHSVHNEHNGVHNLGILGSNLPFGSLSSQSGSAQHSQGSVSSQGTKVVSSQSTQNRFGEGSKSEGSYSHNSFGSGPLIKTPSFTGLSDSSNGNSAYSSAIVTGSGSASAFASTGSSGFGLKNENLPSANFGLASQHTHGSKSDSTIGSSFSAPATASASASVSGIQKEEQSISQNGGTSVGSETSAHLHSTHESAAISHKPSSPIPISTIDLETNNQPSSATASASGSQFSLTQSSVQNGEKSESDSFLNRFGEGQQSGITSSDKFSQSSEPGTLGSSSAESSANVQQLNQLSGSSSFGISSQHSGLQSQSSGKIPSTSNEAFVSSVQPTQPTVGFLSSQGPTKVPDTELSTPLESSGNFDIHYQSSNQALPTPTVSSQVGPIDTTITQEQGVDYSYFYKQPSKPFITPPKSTSFGQAIPVSVLTDSHSSSSYSGITQAAISPFTSGSTSTSTRFGTQSSLVDSKPSVGSSLSGQQNSIKFGSNLVQKPIVQSQTQFGQSFIGQTSDSTLSPTQQYQGTIYQYNKPAVSLSAQDNKVSSSVGQTTLSQTKPSQISTDYKFGSQQISYQSGSQSSSGQIIGQKPSGASQLSGSNYQQSQLGLSTQFGQKVQTTQGSSFSSNTQNQQLEFGKKPTSITQSITYTQQTVPSISQTSFVQKPIDSSQVSSVASKPQTSQGSSFTSNTYSVFGTTPSKSPVGSIQTQFGSTESRFGQSSQSNLGSSVGVSSTTTKPFGSTYQQIQFGSPGSQFTLKPQTTKGSSFTYSQSQVSSKKPSYTFGTQFGQNSQKNEGTYQQAQFGSSGSQSSLGQTQFGSKPISTQFGSTISQFAQNTQGSGLVSTTAKPSTQKPFSSSYQQVQFASSGTQFGAKPQVTQGSSFTSNTYTQSQSSQFGKKPSSIVQATFQQSQFGQNKDSAISSTTAKPSWSQKPFGSTFQQTQFGSQFTQSQSNKGNVVSTTSKPVFSQTSFGQSSQQSQSGSSGFQFGQNTKDNKGSNIVSSTSKPIFGQASFGVTTQQFGSSGSQYGIGSQLNKGSNVVSTTAKPVFGQTSFGSNSQKIQSGSTTFQFGQNSQYNKGSSVVSTTAKPVFGQTSFGSGSQQFGSSGSQFGTGSQINKGSNVVSSAYKPTFSQTSFGSSSQQFGSSGSQLNNGVVSTTSKPIVVQTSFGSSSQQTQFGSTGSQFGVGSQLNKGSSVVSTAYKPTFSQTSFGSSTPQFGSSVSQFNKGVVSTTSKPIVVQTSFSSSSQQTQFGSSGSQLNNGVVSTTTKPIVSQTSFGSSSQQTQFGSSGSKFGVGSQLNKGSSSTTYKPIVSQTSFGATSQQFGSSGSQLNKGVVSTTTKPIVSQTSFGSSSQKTQLGSSVGSQINKGSNVVSSTYKPIFSQTSFGSGSQQLGSSGSQFNSGSQQNKGSSVISSAYKPTIGQTTFGSSSQQFGSSGSQFNNGVVSTTFKPIVSQTSFGSSSQQTQSGLSGSQFGIGSQVNKGSNVVSSSYKPIFSQTSFGFGSQQLGSSGSQFSSGSQLNKGVVSTTSKPVTAQTSFGSSSQQTLFGSSGSQLNKGSNVVSSTYKPSLSQTSFGSGSQQFGSSGSQFGVGSQVNKGSSVVSSAYKPTFSQTSFGSSSQSFVSSGSQSGVGSQLNKDSNVVSITSKPIISQASFGSTSQQFESTGSQTGLGSQSNKGSYVISTVSKPTLTQVSTPQNNQIGSSGFLFGQNSQVSKGSDLASSVSKPSLVQTSFGSTGTQYGFSSQQNKNSAVVTTTSKPIVGSSQQTQFIQKPTGNTQTGSTFQLSQIESTDSRFGEKPETVVSTAIPSVLTQSGSFYQKSESGSQVSVKPQSLQGQAVQTSQYGLSNQKVGTATPVGSISVSQYNQQGTVVVGLSAGSESNKKSDSSSGSGFDYQQTQSSVTSGAQFGQSSQTSQGSVSQTQPIQNIQFGIKPVGSSQLSSTQSRFGESSQSSAFASASSGNVAPFGISQVGQVSKYQQTSQFGQAAITTQKPFISSFSQNADYSGSQFGQTVQSNIGSGQFGLTQKPFGSQLTQKTYQSLQGQKPVDVSQSSSYQVDQAIVNKPVKTTVQTIQGVSGQSTQGSLGNTQSGSYNYQKPQSVVTALFGGEQGQKVQEAQTNFNSVVSTVQTPISGESFNVNSVSTQESSQTNVGSSQFFVQPTKAAEISGPIVQTSYNQLSGQSFKPASTQGSIVQSQNSAVSTSQFVAQPTKPATVNYFSGQPFQSGSSQRSSLGSQAVAGSVPLYTITPSQGVLISSQIPSQFTIEGNKQSIFSSNEIPSFPSRLSSNVGQSGFSVPSVQNPIISVPGYEIHTGSNGFVGLEEFGGPRDPPRFDDKTGYYY